MKVLVANRGEIAVRIMRACRELGFQSVAVYSDCDRLAPHVRYADEAYEIGANEPAESYLNIDRLVDVAREADVTAVHPGYGFLSENAKFAAACREANLTFVGPSADVIALMGGKVAARQAAQRAGVPVVPGTNTPLDPNLSDIEVKQIARKVGYPLFVKAVAGGGGRGMRVVREPEGLTSALREARSESQTVFGDELVYLERQIVEPRHIEVQLLGDSHGALGYFHQLADLYVFDAAEHILDLYHVTNAHLLARQNDDASEEVLEYILEGKTNGDGTDAETGEQVLVDSGHQGVREFYAAEQEAAVERRDVLFRKTGVDEIAIDATKPYVDPLIHFFRARMRRH